MPRQPTVTEIRLDNIVACLTPALILLNELSDAFGPPFIQLISNTVDTLINMLKNVKQNKNDCAQLLENIHKVLYAIINLHLKSEIVGSLPPAMLDNIGRFTETLHKIYVFVEAQQDGKKIKHLFRNGEMQKLLKSCHVGLNHAMEVFGITARPAILNNIGEMKNTAKFMHKELLELIQNLSDDSTSSDGSSPKIFHGRQSELDDIMKILDQESPRIAILGGGGMGKTSLAKAVLHHPDTSAKFEHKFFVSVESANSTIELAALIGLHVGLDPGPDLTKPVIQYLLQKPSCLLVLDNLETVWEPLQSRDRVEEFLSLLTEVQHLALVITMRGAERPAKVQWTRPFLLPLQPLSDDTARQTFIDITDNIYGIDEINQLLQLTDNMPLAVNLIAHLSDYEGISNVSARWETEKTSLLSMGHDRKSNLDKSISLSLSSPRITPDSKKLLGLLSILPDGLSDAELVQSNLLIPKILSCKTALLATSLAYLDGNKRLRSLMPVREHIQQFLPPSQSLIQRLREHFHALLKLYQKYNGKQLEPVVNQITSNLTNLQEVLQRGLNHKASDLPDTIHCTLSLNSFYRVTGRGSTVLMDKIHPILLVQGDHELQIHFTIEAIVSWEYHPSLDQEQLLNQAITHFEHVNNPLLEGQFYHAAGVYMMSSGLNLSQSMQFYQKALQSFKLCEDSYRQSNLLISITRLKYRAGDYCAALADAIEAQRLSRSFGDLYQEASALNIGALCLMCLGDFRQSMTQLQRGKDILISCGISGGRLDQSITISQAQNHFLQSNYAEARSIYSQMLENTLFDKNVVSYTTSLLNIVQIDMMIGGDAQLAYQNLNEAKDSFSHIQSSSGILYCNMIQADMELREEKFELAKARFLECLHLAWGIDTEGISFCLDRLGDVKAWQASIGLCYKWPVIYLGYGYKSKDKLALHKALLCLGDIFITENDKETAANLYTVALEGFTHMNVHHKRAQCMIRLGDLAKQQGHTSEAIVCWKAARPLFEQSLQAKDVVQIDARLLTVIQQKALPDAPVQLLDKQI
ncbi:hypothetical protein DFH08DRAFT_940026 [Mycena albidolilacea]|uniref:Novel STAND NTPase 1 domain-containing protein n=1 Tax=Mycena albidolilacea TaxID=1033008 RepID=A0AAD6ZNS2_9AGAR|nr:hypothetical protein DFH08DRAFT_940026 [Mycena albidolilacea]